MKHVLCIKPMGLSRGEWLQLAVIFQFAYDVRDAYKNKTANEMPAEGNHNDFCRAGTNTPYLALHKIFLLGGAIEMVQNVLEVISRS